MNKKKEIEIIAQTMKYRCRRAKHHCDDCKHRYGEEGDYCDDYKRAELLYEIGVRLSDEVISEIMKELYSTVCTVGKLCPRDIKQMAKARYGVEVDE